MRNWILCACVALVLPCFASAWQPAFLQPDKTPASTQSKGHECLGPSLPNCSKRRSKPHGRRSRKKDKEGYAAFLTDDFQAVEADGDGERPKPHILREVEHSMFTDYSLQLFQVQQLGPHYAFVTYECTMQFPRGSATRFRRIFIGELWTNREGDWKMMRYHETVVR